MKQFTLTLLAACVALTNAGAATEQEIVNDSASVLREFYRMPEKQIPRRIMNDAHGLASSAF